DGAAVTADELEPDERPAGKGVGGDEIDRDLGRKGGEQRADEAHVVVERQPGDHTLVIADPDAVDGDVAAVAHQCPMGDADAARESRAAGGILEIAEVVGLRPGVGQVAGGSGSEFAPAHLPEIRVTGKEIGAFRPEQEPCATARELTRDLVAVAGRPGEDAGHRQRYGKEPRAHTGKEGGHELGAGLPDEADAVPALEAESMEPRGAVGGAVAKLAIGKCEYRCAAAIVEGKSGSGLRRIVERIRQEREVSLAWNSGSGLRNQGSVSP